MKEAQEVTLIKGNRTVVQKPSDSECHLGELRKLFGPSQFGEQGTQSDEAVDIGGSGKRRLLGA